MEFFLYICIALLCEIRLHSGKNQNKFCFSAHLHYFCGQKLLTNY